MKKLFITVLLNLSLLQASQAFSLTCEGDDQHERICALPPGGSRCDFDFNAQETKKFICAPDACQDSSLDCFGSQPQGNWFTVFVSGNAYRCKCE